MQKMKNSDIKVKRSEQDGSGFVAIALIVIGLMALFGVTGLIGAVFEIVGLVIGAVFGVIGTVLGLVFGLIGGVFGIVFGTLGAVLGIVFGTIIIWLPLLLIIGGIAMIVRSRR